MLRNFEDGAFDVEFVRYLAAGSISLPSLSLSSPIYLISDRRVCHPVLPLSKILKGVFFGVASQTCHL